MQQETVAPNPGYFEAHVEEMAEKYLPNLVQRKKWHIPVRNLRVGDLVLVVEYDVPRSAWPLRRIMKVYPGPDDIVRVTDVKAKSELLKRPVSKLALLVPPRTLGAVCCERIFVRGNVDSRKFVFFPAWNIMVC